MSNLGNNPVLNFAVIMQEELDENKHKGDMSWRKDCSLDYLLKRAYEELVEVEQAIKDNKSIETILSECADVGNFMMMIADIYEQGENKNVDA